MPYKSPALAAALSSGFPGIGHFYLGDIRTAAGLMALGGVTLAASVVTLLDGWPAPFALDDPTFLLSSIWFQNAILYSVYAAYRDARALAPPGRYRRPAPTGDLASLVLAPVTPRVLAAPDVSIGLAVMLGAGLLASWAVTPELVPPDGTLFRRSRVSFFGGSFTPSLGATLGELYFIALFLPVGIGEEAFFRGYLQPALAERIGAWGGWLVASLVFGLAHASNVLLIPDGPTRVRYLAVGLPFLTVAGGYMGWVAMRHRYDLAYSVAIHFWYDVLLSTISFALDPDSQPFVVRISLPFGI